MCDFLLLLLCGAVPKAASENNVDGEGETGGDVEDSAADKSIVKLTKADRRAKLKKSKKEAKKQGKELEKTEEKQNPQAAVLVFYECKLLLELIFIDFFVFLVLFVYPS